MLPAGINLNTKLGAMFLGNVAAATLYGITCVQMFLYFNKGRRDSVAFRGLIFFLWILDTLHIVLITHGMYQSLISDFGSLVSLTSTVWSITTQIYIACISDLVIRCIFGRRVWIMTGHNILIALSIAITSLLHMIFGFIFATQKFAGVKFANFTQSYIIYVGFASGMVADILVAGSLCYTLSKSRTGLRSTDTLVNALMVYTINTGLLTTICAAACFITYTVWPGELIFIGIYFCLSKFLLNSLLAMLNGRGALSEKIANPSKISFLDMTSRCINFSSRVLSQVEFQNPEQSLTVNSQASTENPQGDLEDPIRPPKRAPSTPSLPPTLSLMEEQELYSHC